MTPFFIFLFIGIVTLNSFLLGRIFKRFHPDMDSFLGTILGFFTFFILIFFSMLPIYYTRTQSIYMYTVFYSIVQIALLFFYVLNWRFTIITIKINFTAVLVFTLTVLITGAVMLLVSLTVPSWDISAANTYLHNLFLSYGSGSGGPIILNGGEQSFFVGQYTGWDIMMVVFISTFKISADLDVFLIWTGIVCFAFVLGCMVMYAHGKAANKGVALVNLIYFVLVGVVSFVFLSSFSYSDCWIPVILSFYLFVLFKQDNVKLSPVALTIIYVGLYTFSHGISILALILLLFSTGYLFENSDNAFNEVGGLWMCGLIFTSFELINILYLPMSIVFFVLCVLWLLSKIVKRYQKYQLRFSNSILVWLKQYSKHITYGVMVIAGATCFLVWQISNTFSFANFTFENFLFNINNFMGININSETNIIINIVFFSISTLFLLIWIISLTRLNKYTKFFVGDVSVIIVYFLIIEYNFFSLAVFNANPLFMNESVNSIIFIVLVFCFFNEYFEKSVKFGRDLSFKVRTKETKKIVK